jgi:hypothetical protein
MILSVTSLILAEMDELLDRNLVAGITTMEMVVSQLTVNTLALILLNFTSAVFAFIILDVRVPAGNEIYLALLIILTVLSAQYIGFFIASFSISYTGMSMLVLAIYISTFFGCGKIYSKVGKIQVISPDKNRWFVVHHASGMKFGLL